MLRIIQNTSPQGAKSYYAKSDYYVEGHDLAGVWRGEAAKRLGLAGEVRKEDWDALCDNLDPATGNPLTPRLRQDRRVGYDFNFHVPKSVSVLYGLTRDERVLEAFRESVAETMREIESEMQTRVRRDGRDEDRTTGNMVWGEFVHFTARPVDGIPDPHLHAHAFVFNCTYDSVENKWKAGQFAGVKRDAPYFEALFHSKLARRLEELGLATERTKTGWELAGVPGAVTQKFSRRTALIEEKARTDGITDPVAKDELGARTRERKAEEMSPDELRGEWLARMTRDERDALEAVGERLGQDRQPEDTSLAREAVQQAIGHCFERSAVIPERRLLAEAMKRSVGMASPETIASLLSQEDLIVAERDGRRMATTRQVLAEESRMLAFARRGRGRCPALGASEHIFKRDWLNADQRNAVRHVLESRDRVMLIRGGAGTGKTAMMKEAVEAIESGGTRVHVFAPSADASRGVLREAEGFADADTVARLLVDEKMQDTIKGQAIWIDEAGLLGSRAMAQVFDLAERLEARVVLSGDRRQHGSVERGAALRLLEEEAGLVPAEIREIKRQKGDYKEAVRALGEERTEDGFHQLDRLGWVREIGDEERHRALAEEYVASVAEGRTAIVVSPTHREGERIMTEIRSRLRKAGRLTGTQRTLPALVSLNLTEAERADPLSYAPGDVLVYHQNAKGHRKGERVVVGDGPLPLDQAARFQAYRPAELPVTQGDLLCITRNGTSADGKHRLNNGALYEVRKFDAMGNLVLANGWTVAKNYGHLAHGYVVTSHASQGKTVDRVFIGQSSDSFPASSREQFYVSASRGRERVTVYTDDKQALLDAVSRADDRVTATELLGLQQGREPSSPVRSQERNAREGIEHER